MPNARLRRSLRATLIGLAVNTVLAAAKLSAGILGRSYALIADATESLADIFSSIVVWRGIVVAAAPAGAEHPYGHGKAEPIAAAIVSGTLLAAAGGIALQAIREILWPRYGLKPFTLIVLVVSIVVKEALFRFVLREGTALGSTAVSTDAWHHRSDVITSLAALIGISIAIVGGPAYKAADSVAAIVAAMIIAWNGFRLLRPALNELMDTAPSEDLNARIVSIACGIAGVDAVEKCIVRKMGYQYFVDMHVEVDPKMTVERAHHISHDVRDEVRRRLPNVSDVLVHIEPTGQGDDRE